MNRNSFSKYLIRRKKIDFRKTKGYNTNYYTFFIQNHSFTVPNKFLTGGGIEFLLVSKEPYLIACESSMQFCICNYKERILFMNINSLQQSERILFSLRSLYNQHGYSLYKMNKFEEYDLYARNKDFLISDRVITFTDTTGKLMALKPDVTLSIVKNTKDDHNTVQKLYYNENVYRVSKGNHSFKEIMQVGLEALGNIDDYCIYEVLKLAADSLVCTNKTSILEFSHLGLLSELLDYIGIQKEERAKVMHYIAAKNTHELMNLCHSLEIPEEKSALLKYIVSIYGKIEEVLPQLQEMLTGIVSEEVLSSFTKIAKSLQNCNRKELFRIDFSIVSDIRYYNGFVFRGFIQGIPNHVLSGGQYDTMMQKMKRTSKAIGFAVYLDVLEQFEHNTADFDVDNLLLYDDTCTIDDVEKQINQLNKQEESVLVQRQLPSNIKYRRLLKLTNGEVEIIENNA